MSRTGKLLSQFARREGADKRDLARAWMALSQRQRAAKRRFMRRVLGLPRDRLEWRQALRVQP